MAPLVVDKVYLPDIEPCLNGETVILSWRLVASTLADTTGHRQSSQAIIDFLTNSYVQTFFTKPATVFEDSTGGNDPHKQAFETRTSAVQAAPTPNDKYDIKTIKEDSLWLSRNAHINLEAALRIVVIEFQTQARSQLTGEISSQDVANLQEAAGATKAQSSSIIPGLTLAGARDAADIQKEFEEPESRRKRIFQTYLSERRYYAKTTDYVFTMMLQEKLPSSPVTAASTMIRNSFLQAFGLTSLTPQSEAPTKTYHALVSQYFTLLSTSISQCGSISAAEDPILRTEELQNDETLTCLEEAFRAMTVAFQLLDLSSQVMAPAELVEQWFNFLDQTSFLANLESYEALVDLARPIYCLLCVISLTIFNLPRVMLHFQGEVEIDNNVEYIGSSDVLQVVHKVIISAAEGNIASAMPVVFGWVPIIHAMWTSYQERAERRDALQNQKAVETYDSGTQMIPGAGRRNSSGSITTIDKTGYDDFLINEQMDRDVAQIHNLAAFATNNGEVFTIISGIANCLGAAENAAFAASVGSRMRIVLLQLLKVTYRYVQYQADSVSALQSVLSAGHGYWNLSTPGSLSPKQDIVSAVLNDEEILEYYFDQASNRFPLEFPPFVSLCRILLGSSHESAGYERIKDHLLRKSSITFELPPDFDDYELTDEGENVNGICLVEDIPLFLVTSSRKRISMDEESFIIPAGTQGRLVADEGRAAQLFYEHSTLALLGKRLETNFSHNTYRLALDVLSPDEVSETVALFATLIRTEVRRTSRQSANAESAEAGLTILAEASRALARNKDIISVICDIFDEFLEHDPEIYVLAVLTACLQFLHAILPLCPGRVWSYMARSAILGSESRVGRLSRLAGSLELSTEQFELLRSSVRFFSELIDSSMSSSVQRKAVTKTTSRQPSKENIWLGVSDKIVTQISVSISHAVVEIFENSSTWKFTDPLHQTILMGQLVPILNNVILYTYSMDDATTRKTLTAPLETAAKYVIDSFLSPSAGSLRIQPLLATFVSASNWPLSMVSQSMLEALSHQSVAVLDLTTTLVRIANYFDRSSSTIELQMFKATPFLARLCAVDDRFRTPAILLLEALVVSAGKTSGEPPSLLGYLGPQTSRAFLQFLSTLDRPFNQVEEVGAIWRFFSTIVRNRQQWLANCLLTGKTSRDARTGVDKTTQVASSSVLTSALNRLCSIGSIPTMESIAILDFLTSAQNYWPWTIFNLRNNNEFMSGLRKYVRELKSSSITSKLDVVQACNEARIAAYIAETFAMQLFHFRQIGQAGPLAKDLAQDLDYFLRDGVLVSGYNNSLHANFAKNFSNRYPGCTLDNFKRTFLELRPLGIEYYYAMNFADGMLQFDSGWLGPSNNGFKSEMEKANANLALVDAQIALFHAWEFLLLELSNCLPHHYTLKKQSLQVAEQCLAANEANQGHELVFERLTESRVNLALMLVQRVVDNTPSATDVAQLLNVLWSTISQIEEPYQKEHIPLHRTLLKLLYVTLRAQVRSSDQRVKNTAEKHANSNSAAAVSQTVLSILDRTVAKGFRTLVSLIHDSEASILPEDIAILTAIMQACLCIPGINQCQTQIVNIMAAHDAVHVAVSLYSWSDKLAKGDPIYGELSLLFLLELSALPTVAEQLACDGLLNHLTSASMANYLSRPNVSPYAEGVGPQRCYSIWAKAIVPLLLNILMALGQTIAPEVAYVLNQFPNLMTSSVERFEAPGGSRMQHHRQSSYITLLSVSEIHSLALMTRVLHVMRANNTRDIPEVEWDSASLLENVEFWLGGRKVLRERLLPMGLREAEWKTMKPTVVGQGRGCESKLEEKVVEQLGAVKAVLSEDLE